MAGRKKDSQQSSENPQVRRYRELAPMIRAFRDDLGMILRSGEDISLSPVKMGLFQELCKAINIDRDCINYKYVRTLTVHRSEIKTSDAYLILGQVYAALESTFSEENVLDNGAGDGRGEIRQLPMAVAVD